MNKQSRVFAFVAVMSAGILLISNLVATKIWSLGGLPFDCGVILFPISYILGDVSNEVFGKKPSQWIATCGVVLNLVALAVFAIAAKLPAYPDWQNQEAFVTIFSFAPRVIIASLVAYFVSSLLDIGIFGKIRESQGGSERLFFARALGSSAVSRLVDSLVFETIAFLGVLPFSKFVLQVFSAYAAAIGLETILFPLTCGITKLFKKSLRVTE